ncbi:hypothetical protein D3C80_1898360 [compost metagenome]
MHHGTQVVGILLDFRLLGFQTVKGLLSRVLHQAVRIGLIDRVRQRRNHQQGNHK